MSFIPGTTEIMGESGPAYYDALHTIGLGTPIARFAAGTALAGALLYAVKPAPFFVNGHAKPWALVTLGADGDKAPCTAVPWYLVAVLIGFAAATFV